MKRCIDVKLLSWYIEAFKGMRSETEKEREWEQEWEQANKRNNVCNKLSRSVLEVTRINTFNKGADQQKEKYICVFIYESQNITAINRIEFAMLYLKINSMIKGIRSNLNLFTPPLCYWLVAISHHSKTYFGVPIELSWNLGDRVAKKNQQTQEISAVYTKPIFFNCQYKGPNCRKIWIIEVNFN